MLDSREWEKYTVNKWNSLIIPTTTEAMIWAITTCKELRKTVQVVYEAYITAACIQPKLMRCCPKRMYKFKFSFFYPCFMYILSFAAYNRDLFPQSAVLWTFPPTPLNYFSHFDINSLIKFRVIPVIRKSYRVLLISWV